jgi:GNAT superfamily N-acetyltransferase
MKDEFDDYEIKLTMSLDFPKYGEAEEYFNAIVGKIYYYGNGLTPRLCGKLVCLYVNLERVTNDRASYFEILDAESSETAECMNLFNSQWKWDTGYLKKATLKALRKTDEDYLGHDNFIYVQRLEILPAHRGKRLGKYFLEQTFTHLTKILQFEFFALKPFPLQSEGFDYKKGEWRSRLALDKLEKNHKKATKKLRDLYSELGFVLVKGTNLMVCSSDYYME